MSGLNAGAGADASWPRITIVTPSFNQGRYIEATIRSVLDQRYPNLEFIVLDAASTDGSVAVIRKYSSELSYWRSAPDEGQSHAIQMGLERATGDIFNWLNSDDRLAPGALADVARVWRAHRPHVIVGRCVTVDAGANVITEWSPRLPAGPGDFMRPSRVVMAQPSTFLSTAALREIGGVRRDLHYVMDWELYLRLTLHFSERLHGVTTDTLLAEALHHDAAKASVGSDHFREEARRIVIETAPQWPREDWRAARSWLRSTQLEDVVASALHRSPSPLRALVRVPLRIPAAIGSRFYWGAVRRALAGASAA